MKTRISLLAILSLALTACMQDTGDATKADAADILFVNGDVYTMDTNRRWSTSAGSSGSNSGSGGVRMAAA